MIISAISEWRQSEAVLSEWSMISSIKLKLVSLALITVIVDWLFLVLDSPTARQYVDKSMWRSLPIRSDVSATLNQI